MSSAAMPDAPLPEAPAVWPSPPACVPAGWLDRVPQNARLSVAGLVLLRQRPGTAGGVIFVTLEDETGTVNVIVWRRVYETFRRAVIAGRLLRVTGRLQREGAVTHVIADRIEDLSGLLDSLLKPEICRAADQPGTTCPDPRAADRTALQVAPSPGRHPRNGHGQPRRSR